MRGPWRGGNLPLLKRNFGGLLVNPLTFPCCQVREKKKQRKYIRSSYVYLISSVLWCVASTFSSEQMEEKKFSRYLKRALSLLPMNCTLLPPSLPPSHPRRARGPYIAIFVLFHVETSIYNKLY